LQDFSLTANSSLRTNPRKHDSYKQHATPKHQMGNITQSYDVLILGGGAAGLMCAVEAAKRGRSVCVIEHAERIGKKILISGGGRCNFTNLYAKAECYISQNPHFCKSALARYTPQDFISLVERHGIAYHEKTLGQLFCDHSARQITGLFERECATGGVEIRVQCSVEGGTDGIKRENDAFTVQTTQGCFQASSFVIATGGPSIPKMGATGFGYEIARMFGLALTPIKPALVPVTFGAELQKFGSLSGVSLESIALCNGVSFREHVLFTHRGMSGPAVLQASSYWEHGDSITFNTLPTLVAEEFVQRHAQAKISVANALATVLPKRFAEEFLSHYAPQIAVQPCVRVSRKELLALVQQLQVWSVQPNGTEGYAKAEVTAGGVDTNALSSKTMEATTVPGLYCIGEVVDVTGWLGGYNFQWAWASGYAAGQVV